MELVKNKHSERRERLRVRNEKIREKVLEEWKKGYRMDKIIQDLQKVYALDAYTIEAIVREKGCYNEF